MFEYDVFLSFSSTDEEIVRPIWQELSLSGLRVFWSDETLKQNAGQSFFKVIQQSLVKSQHLILICTEASLSSNWVQLEYETFFSNYHIKNEGQRRLILLPQNNYRLSNLPPFLKNLHVASTVKEIIPIVGGIDIQALMREKDSLSQQLSIAKAKITQLQFDEEKTSNRGNEKKHLQLQINSLNSHLSQERNSNINLQRDLSRIKIYLAETQKENDLLIGTIEKQEKSTKVFNSKTSSFYAHNKTLIILIIFVLLMTNLLGMALSDSKTASADQMGLLFLFFFIGGIGIGIRYIIKVADSTSTE